PHERPAQHPVQQSLSLQSRRSALERGQGRLAGDILRAEYRRRTGDPAAAEPGAAQHRDQPRRRATADVRPDAEREVLMASGTQRTDQDAAGPDALLTEILDFSPTAVAISAVADTTLLYVNPAMAAYFGTTKQAALAMPALSFVEPADQTKVREALAARGEIRRFPVRSRMPEGRVSLFSCKLITFRGTPAVLSWLEDRTEQVRREKEILSTA